MPREDDITLSDFARSEEFVLRSAAGFFWPFSVPLKLELSPRVAVTSNYTTRIVDVHADAEAILRVWLRTYSDLEPLVARRKLEDHYLGNPAGEGTCVLLEQDSEPVGAQCLLARRFQRKPDTLSVGMLADYVVDPEHRSLGPALMLLKDTVDAGRTRMDFLYGLPNRKSEAILKRFGAYSPGQLSRYARPLKSADHIDQWLPSKWRSLKPAIVRFADTLLSIEVSALRRRYGHGLSWTDQTEFDELFESCWSATSRDNLLIADRSAATMRWRYPQEGSRRVSIARDPEHRPEGYVVWRLADNTVHILDFYCRQPRSGSSALLSSFASHVRSLKARAIDLEFAGAKKVSDQILAAGFRIRGSNPIYVITAGTNQNAAFLDDAYFTSFDRDAD